MFQVAMNMPNLTTLQLTNNTGLRGPLLPANAEPITTATCALSTVSFYSFFLFHLSFQCAVFVPSLRARSWVVCAAQTQAMVVETPMRAGQC